MVVVELCICVPERRRVCSARGKIMTGDERLAGDAVTRKAPRIFGPQAGQL